MNAKIFVTFEVRKLETGYYHIRGIGPCNFAQPLKWPCSETMLDESFFPEAGLDFRRSVFAENDRLLESVK